MTTTRDLDSWRSTMRAALTQAMRERRSGAVRAIRAALGAIDNAEAADVDDAPHVQDGRIAGGVQGLGAAEVPRRTLTADDAHTIVRAEAVERRRWADEYETLGDHEAAARLRDEAETLETFL